MSNRLQSVTSFFGEIEKSFSLNHNIRMRLFLKILGNRFPEYIWRIKYEKNMDDINTIWTGFRNSKRSQSQF